VKKLDDQMGKMFIEYTMKHPISIESSTVT